MSINDGKWQADNPFMPQLKTADEIRHHIAIGGIGAIESRIEAAFSARLKDLKEKIIRLESIEKNDLFLSNTLINSILVDCRALFFESGRLQRNATLQNVYRARRMDEKAEAVDEILNQEVIDGKSLREVIKAWVDKRIVHMDWLWDEQESAMLEDIKGLIFSEKLNGLFGILKGLVDEYEAIVGRFGKDAKEQFELTLRALTGDQNME